MIALNDYADRVAALLERPLFSGPHIGLAFPPGWMPLIETLVAAIEALPGGEELRVRQTKTKLGGLRFRLARPEISGDKNSYAEDPIMAAAEELITVAETRSEAICMVCGEAGDAHIADRHEMNQLAAAPFTAALRARGLGADVW